MQKKTTMPSLRNRGVIRGVLLCDLPDVHRTGDRTFIKRKIGKRMITLCNCPKGTLGLHAPTADCKSGYLLCKFGRY